MSIFDLREYLERQRAGKAFPDSRFFHSDAPLSTYIPGQGTSSEQGLSSQREAKRHLQAYGGDQSIDWVMDAVEYYATTVSSAAWHVETPDGQRVANIDPTFQNLLDQPNPFCDYIEHMELLVTDLLLVGNAYWYKWRVDSQGRPLALYRLSPSDVKIRAGKQGIDKYVYQPEGVDQPLEISPDEIIHFRRPNPHSAYYGLGVIQGGGRPLDLELALTDAQAYYYENKADPSLIVQSDRRIPKEVFNNLRMQLRARASGPHRSGELLVLQAGLKASTLSPTASEALFAEISQLSMMRVLAMFKIHPKLIGYSTTEAAADKLPDLQRQFDNKVMRPFMGKLQAKITAQLAAAWGYKLVIDYTYVMAPEDALQRAGQLAGIPGMTPKEIRLFLRQSGFDFINESTGDTEADKLILSLPGNEATAQGFTNPGFADPNLPGEPGRPPKQSSTRAIPPKGAKLPRGSRARRPSGKALTLEEIELELQKLAEGKAVGPDGANISIGNKLTGEQRPQDPQEASRTADLDALAASAQNSFDQAIRVLERGLLDVIDGREGKAFKSNDLLKRLRNANAWKSFADLLEKALIKHGAQAASAAAVHLGSEGHFAEEDLDYESIAKSVVHRQDGIRAIVRSLKASISENVRNHRDDKGKAREALSGALTHWLQGKAAVVALTEMAETYNEATLTALESAGHSKVFVNDGHDTDQPCVDADGSVWDIDFAREHRTEHPNCRRSFLPVPSEA